MAMHIRIAPRRDFKSKDLWEMHTLRAKVFKDRLGWEGRVLRGHRWIFSNEIARLEGTPLAGTGDDGPPALATAGGNDEQVTKARKIIMYAVVGIVIILLSYTIVTFVSSALG